MKRVVITVLAILFLLLPSSLVFSAGKPIDITASPTIYEIASKPGTTIKENLRLRNNLSDPIEITVEIKKLRAEGNRGASKIEDLDTADEFKSWIIFAQESYTLNAKEWTDIPFTVELPDSAAFGYYWVFYIAPKETSAVPNDANKLTGAVAIPVLLNAQKEGATVDARLADFRTTNRFSEYLPVTFETTFGNSGNIHVKPQGSIFIYDWKGTEITSLKFNEQGGNILPGSSRVFDNVWSDSFITREEKTENGQAVKDKDGNSKTKISIKWDKLLNFRMGKYKAKAILFVPAEDKDIPFEADTSFWVVPWKFFAVIFAFVLFLIYREIQDRKLKNKLKKFESKGGKP